MKGEINLLTSQTLSFIFSFDLREGDWEHITIRHFKHYVRFLGNLARRVIQNVSLPYCVSFSANVAPRIVPTGQQRTQ